MSRVWLCNLHADSFVPSFFGWLEGGPFHILPLDIAGRSMAEAGNICSKGDVLSQWGFLSPGLTA